MKYSYSRIRDFLHKDTSLAYECVGDTSCFILRRISLEQTVCTRNSIGKVRQREWESERERERKRQSVDGYLPGREALNGSGSGTEKRQARMLCLPDLMMEKHSTYLKCFGWQLILPLCIRFEGVAGMASRQCRMKWRQCLGCFVAIANV